MSRWWNFPAREIKGALKVLTQCRPDAEVREVIEEISKEILLKEPPRKRKIFDRYWRMRKVDVLKIVGHLLDEETIEEAVRGLLSTKRKSRTLIEATVELYFLPFVPKDLKKEILNVNHQYFTGTKRAKRALDRILPVWLVKKSAQGGFFSRRENVPMFFAENNYGWYRLSCWDLIDETNQGALISLIRFESRFLIRVKDLIKKLEKGERAWESKIHQETVVLLKDVSYPEKGYAIRVPPYTNTVSEAIAWMYQQDPQKFKGFDIEV